MSKFWHYGLVALTIIVTAVVSKHLWLLPVELLADDFYMKWLTYRGGHVSFWVVLGWFIWGAGKGTAAICQNDTLNSNFLIKMTFLAPIAPLLNFKLQRPYFSERIAGNHALLKTEKSRTNR